MDFVEVQAPAKQGLDVAVAMGLLARGLHESLHSRIALEITFDVLLRLAARDTKLSRQTESAHAVHQAEIDCLRGAPLIGVDLVRRHAEYFRGRRTMHVLVAMKRGEQAGVAGQMRHDTQLNLRIIRRKNLVAWRRDKCLTDAAAFLGAYRDVLQIRVVR